MAWSDAARAAAAEARRRRNMYSIASHNPRSDTPEVRRFREAVRRSLKRRRKGY